MLQSDVRRDALDRPLATDADYLNLLARKVFHAGFDKSAVDRRWPAFERAFYGFEPEHVAAMTEVDVARLVREPGLIRNWRKLWAVIENARHFVAIAKTHGSWRAWLAKLADLPYEQRADTLMACLLGCGPTTVFYFLLEAGEATLDDKPDHVR